MPDRENLAIYPGGDLVAKGLADLDGGMLTEEALLVLVASTRLTGLGFTIRIPDGVPRPYEHALYEAIIKRLPRAAYSAYNALIRKVVSFAQAYDHNQPLGKP